MADVRRLSHLIKLVDDESPRVRQCVAAALQAFGPELDQALNRLPEPPDARQRAAIHALVGPLFAPGQLVKHKRYGYRGVVVAVDETCRATEAWYSGTPSHPDRNQPWYHLLVHDGEHTPYAAQSSLEPDDSHREIRHTWINDFFSGFAHGSYIRNQKPWTE